jgi:hypothetical protein
MLLGDGWRLLVTALKTFIGASFALSSTAFSGTARKG